MAELKFVIEKSPRIQKLIDHLYEKMPDVTITSDIIVGFPGETEEDFAGTLEMIERVRFDMIYSFIFSPRKGTPAAEMEDSATDKEKGECKCIYCESKMII